MQSMSFATESQPPSQRIFNTLLTSFTYSFLGNLLSKHLTAYKHEFPHHFTDGFVQMYSWHAPSISIPAVWGMCSYLPFLCFPFQVTKVLEINLKDAIRYLTEIIFWWVLQEICGTVTLRVAFTWHHMHTKCLTAVCCDTVWREHDADTCQEAMTCKGEGWHTSSTFLEMWCPLSYYTCLPQSI